MFVHVKELGTLINYKLNICQHCDVSAEKTSPVFNCMKGSEVKIRGSLVCSGLWSDHTEGLGSVVGTTILGGY